MCIVSFVPLLNIGRALTKNSKSGNPFFFGHQAEMSEDHLLEALKLSDSESAELSHHLANQIIVVVECPR